MSIAEFPGRTCLRNRRSSTVFANMSLPMEGFAAKRASTFHNVAGVIKSLRLELKCKLAMIRHMVSEKIVAHEVQRKSLIPRSADVHHFGMSLISVHQQLNFSSPIPGEVERCGRIANVPTIHLDQCTLWIRIHCDSPMDAANLRHDEE